MVPSKSPAGEEACVLCAKAAQKMEEARLHEAIEAGTKQRSNWTWHESHISHESHWHFDNIFNYFDIFYAVSRWKRAFLCDIHWCHWCLAGFMQEVGPVPISDLSDPFVRSVCHKNTGSLSGSWFPGQCRWRWRNPSVAETSFSCVQPCQRVKWHLGGSVESSVTVGSVFYFSFVGECLIHFSKIQSIQCWMYQVLLRMTKGFALKSDLSNLPIWMTCWHGLQKKCPSKQMLLGEGATEVGEVESASPWLSRKLEAKISLLTAF